MAFNPKHYPPYWKQFSKYIREERAQNKCEKCGAQNGFLKVVSKEIKNGVVFVDPNDQSAVSELNSWLINCRVKVSTVVLTVAHLDNRGGVCQCKRFFGFKCAKPSHVFALCQACHLNLDREKHLAVQAKNRAIKKDAQRGLLSLV